MQELFLQVFLNLFFSHYILKIPHFDKKIVLQGGTVLVNKLAGTFFGYLIILFISRKYGAATLGVYIICYTILMVVCNLGKCGMDVYILQKTSYLYPVRDNKLKKYYYQITKLVLAISLSIGLVLVVGSKPISSVFFESSYYYVIYAAALGVIPLSLSHIDAAVLNGMEDYKKFSFTYNTSMYVFSFIFLLVLSFFTEGDWVVYFSLTFGTFATFLIARFWVYKKIHHPAFAYINKDPQEKWKGILNNSYPMMLTASMFFLVNWTDSLMLGILTDNEQVGLYSVASRIASVIGFISFSINSVAAPKFANSHQAGVKDTKTIKSSTKLVSVLSLFLVIIILVGGNFFLSIFGEEFKSGYVCLILLAIGYFISNVFSASSYILQMSDNQDILWKCLLVGLILNILLNYLLIPVLGIEGASLGSAISMVTWNAIAFLIGMKKINISLKFNYF